MKTGNIFGMIIGGLILFFIISIAITALPYIAIFILIWYVVSRVLRPTMNKAGGTYRTEWEGKKDTTSGNPQESRGPEVDNVVKSVQDEDFFRQTHDVVDVDFDEEEK
jgi:hypothetical protein